MKRPGIVLSAVAAVLMFAVSAQAQETTDTSGRYAMKDVDDGLLRLDTQSGEVSHCRKLNTAWTCSAVADDRTALQDEITRLQKENEALRQKQASADAMAKSEEGKSSDLPSDADLDKIMSFMEKFMRRFFDFAKSLRDSIGEQA